jgi:hypothetical protein
MKIAVLGESEADEAFTRTIADAVFQIHSEGIPALPRIVGRSYSQVRAGLAGAIRHLYYQSDAHGLIVLVDSDEAPVHDATWAGPGACQPRCRTCLIRADIAGTIRTLKPDVRPMLKVATAVAVPAIESWRLFGTPGGINEAEWRIALEEQRYHNVKRELKARVRQRRPPGVRSVDAAIADAARVADDLPGFRVAFPSGFGVFEQDLLAWM